MNKDINLRVRVLCILRIARVFLGTLLIYGVVSEMAFILRHVRQSFDFPNDLLRVNVLTFAVCLLLPWRRLSRTALWIPLFSVFIVSGLVETCYLLAYMAHVGLIHYYAVTSFIVALVAWSQIISVYLLRKLDKGIPQGSTPATSANLG